MFGVTEKNEPKKIALEERTEAGDRLFSPSAGRNRDAIRDVFTSEMPAQGAFLEIASGTGEHGAHFAAAMPKAHFLPGDPDIASRASIEAWTHYLKLSNVAPPHAIDASAGEWEAAIGAVDCVYCINMIHIAPFDAAKGLMRGAGKILNPGGRLFLYGPFARNGVHSAPSNVAFDASLKARDARWGVRDLDRDITPLAEAAGLRLSAVHEMPANNLSVIFISEAATA